MPEPRKLIAARAHLAKAEAGYRDAKGLFHLEEGLTLLEEVAATETDHEALAKKLAAAYSARICGFVGKLVGSDPALPEPELEHLFQVMRTFDQRGFELPQTARATKIELARRLVDRYLEGHPEAEKRAALEELTRISRDAGPRRGKAR